jgi:hypothetical protein
VSRTVPSISPDVCAQASDERPSATTSSMNKSRRMIRIPPSSTSRDGGWSRSRREPRSQIPTGV